jgi:hypothetical protein
MNNKRLYPILALLALTLTAAVVARSSAARPTVGVSPWGPKDEIGRLNLMTADSRAAVLARIAGGKIYDLSVE